MFKKTVVVLAVVVLLSSVMLFPVSADKIAKEYRCTDGKFDYTDGVYNYYRLEIPNEEFSINVVDLSNNTSLGVVSGEKSPSITKTLSDTKRYNIVYALRSDSPILLEGLPDQFKIRVEWDIESSGSYETPIPYSFLDFYNGVNGPWSTSTNCGRDLMQLDIDGTGKYPIDPLSYTVQKSQNYRGNGINAFCFGLSFRQLVPLNTGSQTFKLNKVTVTFFVPIAIAQQAQIDALAQEQQNMAEQQEITNEKLDQMPEQIGDEFQGVMDKEKEEASNAADGAAGEMLNIIPNESQGFMDALNGLISAMSYNGTDAKLPIPAIKLPAIKGVMPEIKLTDKLYVDFGEWVSQMPNNVLTVVQVVGTIALIVYCFKELYGTISYAFTLKGGGKGE